MRITQQPAKATKGENIRPITIRVHNFSFVFFSGSISIMNHDNTKPPNFYKK